MKKMNVITYGRVSTEEQKENGFSLNHQKEMLKRYCDIKEYKILKHYVEDYSAKTFNRPEWKILRDYVKKNKNSIDMLLVTKWDRFSRDSEGAMAVIREFSKMGIIINAIEQPLDMTIPENKLILAMYLVIPEIENDKIAQRTKDGMRRAKKEGCFMGKAPFGYSNAKIMEKTSIAPNSDSKIVLKAFTEVAKGIEPVEVIRKKIKDDYGLKLEKQQFYNMLRNVTYSGMIIVPEYKKEKEEIIKAIHQPIIDINLFKKVQSVLDGRKNSDAKFPSSENDLFPLRGNFICPNCGKQVTASKSKGNGGHYEYYHCKSSCKIRLKKDLVHDRIKELLNKISLDENVKELYKVVLSDVIKSNTVDAKARIKELKIEQKSVEIMLENTEDKLLSDGLSPEDYVKIRNRYSNKIIDIENRIDSMKENDTDLMKYVDNSVDLLCQLGNVFNHLQNKEKGSFLRVIYPENLILEKDCFRTNSENSLVELMTRFCKGLQSVEIKKATLSNGFSNEAPPLGLEPRTL
ncbi:recombinase family protein [Flavobacterium daemonense]|uniref:recombinase family protein n=1 Tax=Flavobacterium daemonense TaxID=1393049 RepID=UPI001186D7D7|nr:recombinase family protein [Flavobacterium daemonense]KAF2336313.1 recombinase family protein [Flavobacterium daemonense]